jgi:hypothetical protein
MENLFLTNLPIARAAEAKTIREASAWARRLYHAIATTEHWRQELSSSPSLTGHQLFAQSASSCSTKDARTSIRR